MLMGSFESAAWTDFDGQCLGGRMLDYGIQDGGGIEVVNIIGAVQSSFTPSACCAL